MEIKATVVLLQNASTRDYEASTRDYEANNRFKYS